MSFLFFQAIVPIFFWNSIIDLQKFVVRIQITCGLGALKFWPFL